MGRTGLRGFEWAGLRLTVETPSGTDGFLGFEELPEVDPHPAPDVHVTVEWSRESTRSPNAVPYWHEGALFEVVRNGPACCVSVCDDGRMARFENSFERVRISLAPESRVFPLARPLDDLVLIHRALANGAITLRATAAVRDGGALVLLGEPTPEPPSVETSVWKGWLILEPRPEGIAVHPLPSTMRSGRFGSSCRQAWLAGLHVMDPMTSEGAIDTLDPELGAGEILRYAFAPLAAPSGSERLLETATDLAMRVPIVRSHAARSRFTWRSAGSSRSLAPPAGA